METTENLTLPYIMPQQAQKHVTHNEALRMLDALVQISVVSSDLTEPPATPQPGERYMIPASASGEWADKAHNIAAFQDGAWAYFMPGTGWLAYVEATSGHKIFDGNQWVELADQVSAELTTLNNLDHLGVNATADATNRLALAADASLFNNNGAGHQLKINKASTTDTASMLFQNGFSGRAEIGLAGSDGLSFKVSEDGSDWKEALTADPTSGVVSFPNGVSGQAFQSAHIADEVQIFVDATNGSDQNDGKSVANAVKTISGVLDHLVPGKALRLNLLSDLDWDVLIIAKAFLPLLEIFGRKADNSGYQRRKINLKTATNHPAWLAGLRLHAGGTVHLRDLDIIFDSDKGPSFINFFYSIGFLRTRNIMLEKSVSGPATLYSNGASFVPSHHVNLSLHASAVGYVATGLATGADPNSDWRYPSNATMF